MKKNGTNFVNGETTIIGAGTVVEGNVTTSTSTRIDGTVNGDIVSEGTLIIGTEGTVNGNITTVELMVAGSVKGNVKAGSKIEIVAKGHLTGDIETNSLVIDEAAIFDGKCTMNREADKENTAE